MLFVVLAVFLLIVSQALRAGDTRLIPVAKVLAVLSPVLLVVGLAGKTFVQVEAGSIGIVKLFGKVNDTTLEAGLHLVNPLSEVVMMDAQTQNYTMSAVHTEGDVMGDDAIRIMTQDGLEVAIDISVIYHLIPSEAPKILNDVGLDYQDKLVRPITRSRIRDAAVFYQAVELYTGKRDEFQSRITESITKELGDRGLAVEDVLVRNISLPDSVKGAIEEKIQAEQEAQKMTFVLQKETQEAERKRVEAQGIADSQRIVSDSLNDKLLRYEQIKAWKELSLSPNAKVVVMNGNTPIILGEGGQ
jgi:regulator of protease activity HflC (stomatin/prohibitin superfamily)